MGQKQEIPVEKKKNLTNGTFDVAQVYAERSARFQLGLARLNRIANRLATARLTLFLLMIVLVVLTVKLREPALLAGFAILLPGFLWLVKRAVLNRREIGYTRILIRINEEELQALGGNHTAFDPGMNFIDYQHAYSYDLDIVGEHSLYRLVNRAATPLGRQRLAERLLFPGTDPQEIRRRQEAARELRERIDWRQNFRATAQESDWETEQTKSVSSWLEAPDRFRKSVFYPAAIRINAVITLGITLISLLGALLGDRFPLTMPPVAFLYFLLPVGLIISRTRLINREQQRMERLLGLFRKYAGLLGLIEEEPFNAAMLNELKESLKQGNQPASQIMKKLTGILWGLEVRGNLIVSFLLNAFFLWDILLMIRLERWRRNHHPAFSRWIGIVAEFETISSMANLAFNRPDLTWPEIREGQFSMEILEGGHPLIDPLKRVDNSIDFHAGGQIYLITGANMAGKSTFLRMVGVNMILAMAGGPVCAKRLSMVPVAIHTSVRTNDSLGDDESYFYAELKKLSRIIGRLEQGERVFVIIDEMLKGTNSRDKHSGSAALLRRLVGLSAPGLVATHDIELGNLAAEYPANLANRCFEVATDGDALRFDYRLREGVSQNLNATFLMLRMGIIPAK